MSEQKPQNGFKIKWENKEIEYYGESVKVEFEKLVNYLMSTKPSVPITPNSPDNHTEQPEENNDFSQEYERLSMDSGLPKENIMRLVRFEKRKEFSYVIPVLPAHPDLPKAIRLIVYGLQVGLQKSQVEVSQLKLILKGPNGYPIPGRQLGLVLQDFRESDVIIASHTQGRNKPFCLSTKGLQQAKELLKEST